MKYLNLEMIKKQCNIDEWYASDDNYLIGLATVAEQILEKNLDENLNCIVDDNDGTLPAPLLHACLMQVAHWYRNRETVAFGSPQTVDFGYDYLISQYKNYKTSKI